MSVYGNQEIRKALETGEIVCHPLIPENVRGTSMDVTLGEWYFNCGSVSPYGSSLEWGIYNPFDKTEVGHFFGEAGHAKPNDIPIKGIPEDHPIIWIEPKSRILAHTHEFVGIMPPGTSEMRARSSWGRNGISACLCAGWGDPGYVNRWTMEVQNFNDFAVPIPVGERIAQIIFHHTFGVDGNYGQDGKYQTSTDLQKVIQDWMPEDMLPKSWKDTRKNPLPV